MIGASAVMGVLAAIAADSGAGAKERASSVGSHERSALRAELRTGAGRRMAAQVRASILSGDWKWLLQMPYPDQEKILTPLAVWAKSRGKEERRILFNIVQEVAHNCRGNEDIGDGLCDALLEVVRQSESFDELAALHHHFENFVDLGHQGFDWTDDSHLPHWGEAPPTVAYAMHRGFESILSWDADTGQILVHGYATADGWTEVWDETKLSCKVESRSSSFYDSD